MYNVIKLDNQLNFIFVSEQPINESLSDSEVKTKKYYLSCMDPGKVVESLGAAPLIEMINNVFKGWTVGGENPATGGGWKSNKWNFQDTLEAAHDHGLSNFFSVWVGEDEKMPTQNILQVR